MYFVNKKITYVWNVATRNFQKLRNIDESMRQGEFHKCKEGLGQLTVADRFQEYGENYIKISVPPVLYLLFHEVKNLQTFLNNNLIFFWEFAGIEPVLFVPSLYGYPLVHSILLEVCYHHRNNISHFCYVCCLGNSPGKPFYNQIFSIHILARNTMKKVFFRFSLVLSILFL